MSTAACGAASFDPIQPSGAGSPRSAKAYWPASPRPSTKAGSARSRASKSASPARSKNSPSSTSGPAGPPSSTSVCQPSATSPAAQPCLRSAPPTPELLMSTSAVGGYNQPQNLAELLTVLDEFLRCQELPIAELLAKFIESRGSVHPAFHANNLIDQPQLHRRHNRHETRWYTPKFVRSRSSENTSTPCCCNASWPTSPSTSPPKTGGRCRRYSGPTCAYGTFELHLDRHLDLDPHPVGACNPAGNTSATDPAETQSPPAGQTPARRTTRLRLSEGRLPGAARRTRRRRATPTQDAALRAQRGRDPPLLPDRLASPAQRRHDPDQDTALDRRPRRRACRHRHR